MGTTHKLPYHQLQGSQVTTQTGIMAVYFIQKVWSLVSSQQKSGYPTQMNVE